MYNNAKRAKEKMMSSDTDKEKGGLQKFELQQKDKL